MNLRTTSFSTRGSYWPLILIAIGILLFFAKSSLHAQSAGFLDNANYLGNCASYGATDLGNYPETCYIHLPGTTNGLEVRRRLDPALARP